MNLHLPETMTVPLPKSVGREPVPYGEQHKQHFELRTADYSAEINQRIFLEGLKKVFAVRVGPMLDKAVEAGEEITPELIESGYRATNERLAAGEWREAAPGRQVDPAQKYLREKATELAKAQIKAGKIMDKSTNQPYTKLDPKVVSAVRDRILTSDAPQARHWREVTLAAYKPPVDIDLGLGEFTEDFSEAA